MSVRGPQFIFNYFPPNIMAGGRIFAMFRKEIVPDRYYLTIPERENTTTPVQRKTETHQTFMPWQMTFLSLPRGGPVPREKLRFYDEQGILRSDPMIVQLGRCSPIHRIISIARSMIVRCQRSSTFRVTIRALSTTFARVPATPTVRSSTCS